MLCQSCGLKRSQLLNMLLNNRRILMFNLINDENIIEITGEQVGQVLRELADLCDTGVIEWLGTVTLQYVDDEYDTDNVSLICVCELDYNYLKWKGELKINAS